MRPRRALALVACWLLAGALFALPTLTQLSASLRVAQNIVATSNPGNLHAPLHVTQLLGVWLRGSYKQLPAGSALVFTDALIALALAAAALGAVALLRRRALALAAWLALMLITWLAAGAYATTWVQAKALMLTSPAVVLLAWRMPYHAEHHCFPSVPFHALVKLNALIGERTQVRARGYFAVHRQLLRQLRSVTKP